MTYRSQADLRALLRAVDLVYFDGTLPELTIKWGRCTNGPRKREFYFGFFHVPNLITIHPVHAHAWVPGHILQWTIFHEALHSVLGLEHNEAFHAAERRYLHYDMAVQWCADNHNRLLQANSPPRKELT